MTAFQFMSLWLLLFSLPGMQQNLQKPKDAEVNEAAAIFAMASFVLAVISIVCRV